MRIQITCAGCGKEFQVIPSRINAKYCSQKCRILNNDLKDKCKYCNKDFLFSSSYPIKKFCSKECQKLHWKQKYIDNEIKGKVGNFYKIRFELFKRDNFRCQYCGRNPRDNKTKLVIDHIVPRKLGGTNEINNLITSCEECNLGKRDVLLEKKQLNPILIEYEEK